jgi:hypothetical protein
MADRKIKPEEAAKEQKPGNIGISSRTTGVFPDSSDPSAG